MRNNDGDHKVGVKIGTTMRLDWNELGRCRPNGFVTLYETLCEGEGEQLHGHNIMPNLNLKATTKDG